MNKSIRHTRKAAQWEISTWRSHLPVMAFILLTFLLSISLCACNSSQAHNAASDSEANASRTQESTGSDAQSESAAASEKASPAGTYRLDSDDRYLSYGFSEGRSWVSFTKNGDDYVGVIDEDGALVYQVDLSKLQAGAENGTNGFGDPSYSNLKVNISAYVRTSFFEDGVAWLGLAKEYSLNNGDSTSNGGWAQPGFIVIDKNGNELFTSADGDDSTELTMLGGGAGMFVIKEHVEDFSHNDDYIYVTDSKGTLLTERIECSPNLNSKFSYLGEGIFKGYWGAAGSSTSNDGYILNMANNALYTASGAMPLVPFYEGRSFTGSGCVVTPDDYATEETIAAVLERGRASDGMFGARLGLLKSPESLSTQDSLASWGEGLIFCIPWDRNDSAAYGWYNLDGQLVVPMPDFGEGVSAKLAGSFSGGYAPLELKGKDGENYVTVVGASGKTQCEPMKATLLTHDGRSCYDGPGNSCANGYYAVVIGDSERSSIADADGSVYEIGADDLSGMGTDAILPLYVDSAHKNGKFTRTESLIMGGYACLGGNQGNSTTGAKFISLDGKHVIDECYEY